MEINDQLLSTYVQRLKKKSSDVPIDKKSQYTYLANLKRLNKDGALRFAFHPDAFFEWCEENRLTPSTMNTLITCMTKFMTCLTAEEYSKHFPDETDLSFIRINGILETYRSKMAECQNTYNNTKKTAVQ